MAAQRTILPFTSFSTEVQQAYTEDKVAIMQQYGFSPAVIQENALKKLRRTPGTSFSSSSSSFVAPPQQQQQIQQIAAESAQLAMGVTPQEYPFTFSSGVGFADPYNNSNSNIMCGFPHQPMMNDNHLLAPAPAFYPSLPDMMGGHQTPMGYDNLGAGFAPMGFFDGQQPYTMPVLPPTPAPFLFGGGDGGLQNPMMGFMPAAAPAPPIFSGVPQPLITTPMPTEPPLPATDFPLFPAPPPPPAAIDADIDTSGVPPISIPVVSEDETEEAPPGAEEYTEFFNFDAASDEDKDREFAEMLRLAIAELDEQAQALAQAQAQAGDTGDLY